MVRVIVAVAQVLKRRDCRTVPFIRFMTIPLPETEVKRDLLANTRGGILPSYIYTPEIYHRDPN